MDRRSMMLLAGLGALGAALPLPKALADPLQPDAPAPGPGGPAPAPQAGAGPAMRFSDEFDGPAGSSIDYSKWRVEPRRERIKNPVFWDRPENMGEYRDSRENLFLDGNGNLVIQATREGDKYFGAKITGTQPVGINSTWEARIKLDCQTAGCWPAWWILNDNKVDGGEVDLMEWYGNGEWPSGMTVHTKLDGTSHRTMRVPIDNNWHTWRMTWTDHGMYFWKDYVPGMQPIFEVPAFSMDPWPFNNPGYTFVPILNVAVAGSGGGDPSGGSYPAQMLVDYVRVF
ncbi:glycoside hydrolase family 16 protein [Mycolicibacterium chitae]|nr:glycoside hydrolase family 16 protein [Mycolicibacterium chitae]MCV7104522.1 glycoside hydrolase family 16 protein [Mycolicibacterium chitae]